MSRVAVVVGAGPGLGGSIAVRFAKAGYLVGIVSRSEGSVVETTRRLKETGARYVWAQGDAGVKAEIFAAMAKIKVELGPVNVLVFNATGALAQGPILDVTEAQVLEKFHVLSLGPLFSAQAVLPDMIAAKAGVILVTGATASYRGGAKNAPGSMAMHATKALVHSIGE